MLTKEDSKSREKAEKPPNHSPDLPIKRMKPSLVADEMFPEGAGQYMDIEEVKLVDELGSLYSLPLFSPSGTALSLTGKP